MLSLRASGKQYPSLRPSAWIRNSLQIREHLDSHRQSPCGGIRRESDGTAQASKPCNWPLSNLSIGRYITLQSAERRGSSILNEIQRVPGIFTAIKSTVDRDRSPGRFLLTGSATVLLLRKLADSLAGRMEIIRLHPHRSQRSKGGSPLFSMVSRSTQARRATWYRD
jgi:hypothetical protein